MADSGRANVEMSAHYETGVEADRLSTAASPSSGDAKLASAQIGDARELPWADETIDVVLLLGPLYHLTKIEDRLAALSEAGRVLRPGGLLATAAISRFASTYDGHRAHTDVRHAQGLRSQFAISKLRPRLY